MVKMSGPTPSYRRILNTNDKFGSPFQSLCCSGFLGVSILSIQPKPVYIHFYRKTSCVKVVITLFLSQ